MRSRLALLLAPIAVASFFACTVPGPRPEALGECTVAGQCGPSVVPGAQGGSSGRPPDGSADGSGSTAGSTSSESDDPKDGGGPLGQFEAGDGE